MLVPKGAGAGLAFRDVSYALPPCRRGLMVSAAGRPPGAPPGAHVGGAGGDGCDGGGSAAAAQPGSKRLLVAVTAQAQPGRLVAIMGPSGAGKTTLLGVLAGDCDAVDPARGTLTGEVWWRGAPRQLAAFRQHAAYIRQETADMLLPTATPREALAFAAALRLPSVAASAAMELIESVLCGMRLASCADTLVGDAGAGVRGLSGGERRRLAVAADLLQTPELLLADEPTSNQDSATAAAVLQYVKRRVAGSGGVLIVSLHQPGPALTKQLDDLLLLAPGGRLLFTGAWHASLEHFGTHLGDGPPRLTGLADWLLELASGECCCGRGPGCGCGEERLAALHAAWQHSCEASAATTLRAQHTPLPVLGSACDIAGRKHALRTLLAAQHDAPVGDQRQCELVVCTSPTSAPGSPASTRSVADGAAACAAGFGGQTLGIDDRLPTPGRMMAEGRARQRASVLAQVLALSRRSLQWWWRHPAMLMSEAIQYAFVALFLASCYPRLPLSGVAAVSDRVAVLFMWLTAIVVTAPSRALLTWHMERRLLRRELAAGLYGLGPALGAKLLTSLTLEALQVTAAGGLLYALAGLAPHGAAFAAFSAVSVAAAVCASNAGHLVGLLVPDLHLALPALCVVATLLLAFAGFIVQRMPPWWAWLGDASFASHAYSGLIANEFARIRISLPLQLGSDAASQDADVVMVPGLLALPPGVRANRAGSVGEAVAVMLAFAAGSCVLVLAATLTVVALHSFVEGRRLQAAQGVGSRRRSLDPAQAITH